MNKVSWLSDVRKARRGLLTSAAGTDHLQSRVRELELALLAVMEALEETQSRIDTQSNFLTSMHRAIIALAFEMRSSNGAPAPRPVVNMPQGAAELGLRELARSGQELQPEIVPGASVSVSSPPE